MSEKNQSKENLQDFSDNVTNLCKQLLKFSFNVYHTSIHESLMPNIAISPLSLATTLSVLWAGAKETTAEQLKTLLNFDSAADEPLNIHVAFEELLKTFRPPIIQKSILNLANRVYVHNDYRVHSDYLATAQNHYGISVATVDFLSDVDVTRNAINHWVEQSTHKHVKEPISTGGLDHLSRVMLISCAHFKCPWQRKFYHDPNHPGRFHTDKDKSTAMDVIQQQGRYPYAVSKSLRCSAIELPYSGDRFAFLILLPKDVTGLGNLEMKFNEEDYESLLDSMKMTTVNVMLPRFHVETSLVFAESLGKMGVKDLLSRKTSDLSGLGEGVEDKNEKLFLSALYHGVQVDIGDEGGNKTLPVAQAGNGCFCTSTRVVSFVVDHPFMFIIRDTKSNTIMFMGRVREPTPPRK